MKGILRKIIEGDYTPIEDNLFEESSIETYKEKHGHHFTEKLAECALLMNGSIKWNLHQVESALQGMGYKHYGNNTTLEDLYYLANKSIQVNKEVFMNDTQHLKYAMAVANDPSAYEGHIFCRWVTDMKHKGIEIDWGSY